MFLCDASSDLEEVDSSLCLDSELSSSSLRPCLARPHLRFVPWSLPLDPFFPPFFLRVNDRAFEVFLCNAYSDLEEVNSLLCQVLESSSSSFMENLTV